MIAAKQLGRILNVDLNTGECKLTDFPEAAVEFIGGRGFNLWYLYNHFQEGIDPLAPENVLLLSCGLLTGSSAPGSARLHINSLSPLTHILGSSNIGGYAGAWIRSCNIASIIISGKSEKPVYLFLDSNGPQLLDATFLWGKDAFETQDTIKQFHGNQKLRILTIGPGGENLVRFAAIMSERDHAAGRTGMGAVMGSKNLKALVVGKGIYKHFQATTPSQRNAVKTYATKIRKSPEFEFFSTYGGAGYVKWANDLGIMGIKNYSKVGTEQIDKIDGIQLKKNVVQSSGCVRCPVQCKADLKLEGKDKDIIYTRPEFEPMINLGPKCGLFDLNEIIKLDNLCGRLGLDNTSAATVISFAMDLYERKQLPESLIKDLDLSWGNAQTMEKLLYQMVDGKGLGKILALGIKKAADIIGGDASERAAHVKGLELTAYHPSAIMGSALGYAVSSRGGDFNNVYASIEYSLPEDKAVKEFGTKEAVNIKSIEAKGPLIKKAIITNIIVDCLGLCKVGVLTLLKSFDLEHEVKLIKGLTGVNISQKDLLSAGKKIADLERLFNIRHSKETLEDTLPAMFFKKAGEQGLTRHNFEIMLQEFFNAMGWDKNGIPPESN